MKSALWRLLGTSAKQPDSTWAAWQPVCIRTGFDDEPVPAVRVPDKAPLQIALPDTIGRKEHVLGFEFGVGNVSF